MGVADERHLPTFETTSHPWFGPRKRAHQVLKVHRQRLVGPKRFLRIFADVIGEAIKVVQHVRFVDYTNMHDEFRYTLAIVWTTSDSKARDVIYDAAVECVDATGWYPLPQGERLASLHGKRQFVDAALWPARLPRMQGELIGVETAVEQEGGCCVRVHIGNQSMLLDTGWPQRLQLSSSDRAAFISHAHSDHAGGFMSGATARLPVMMSVPTAELLAARSKRVARIVRSQGILVRPNRSVELGPGVSAYPFTVPHFPGALGLELRDANRSLFFTGDICLRTSRHCYIDQLVERIEDSPARDRFLLLDATMAGRGAGASGSNVAADVLAATSAVSDVVVTAISEEHLLYAYLDLFHTVQKTDTERHSSYFLVSDRLRPMFQMLHDAFISRDRDALDPLLLAQYGSTMSAWGESRWLMWIRLGSSIPRDRRCFWFVPGDELGIVTPRRTALVMHVGRGAPPRPTWARSRVSGHFDTSPWTLHSDAESLVATVQRLAGVAPVILFHNSETQLKSFINRHALEAYPLVGDPLEFG